MIRRTPFRPEIDAFAFNNSWSVDGWELNEIRRYLAREHSGVVRALANSGLAHLIVREVHKHRLVEAVMTDKQIAGYGLCGGMAWAALDYYKRGWVLPRGVGPEDHPTHDGAAGSMLRNYIWRRLLDSMQRRAARIMLLWSLALRLVPGVGAAWVLGQSRKEWRALKGHLDADEPWPIGLVGLARGSFVIHQVLALGYDDPGDGTGTLFVYDSCCPGAAHTIALDFHGSSLAADESCARHGGDTRWKGFFRDAYSPAMPPIAVGLSTEVTTSPVSEVGKDPTVTLEYTARNYSFSPCPPLALRFIQTDEAGDRTADCGGEETPEPLDTGACRTVVLSLHQDEVAGTARYVARCRLGPAGGVEVWKHLPVQNVARADRTARQLRDTKIP
jgi:hypothetical protein